MGTARKAKKVYKLSLKDSELRYRRLFETAQDGILILDAGTGAITDVNPFLIDMLGYTRPEFMGKKLWEMGAFKDIEASQDAFKALQQNKYIRYEDLPLKGKHGQLIQVEFISNTYLVGEKRVIQCNIRDITSRKRTQAIIRRQMEHLTALSAIDQVIAANFDLKLSLSEILTHVAIELDIDAADILILNSNSQTLEYGAERGFRTKSARKVQVLLSQSYAGRAAQERQIIQIQNLRLEPKNSYLASFLKSEEFVCYFGVPLIVKGQVKGVLEVFNRSALEPDPEWFDFLKALAGQAAIAIENTTLFESLQRSNSELLLAYDATIEGWSHALDLRDRETEGHTLRVTEMTLKLARALGINGPQLVQVRWGSLLHDIGKMGVPDEILHKSSALTAEEWLAMKKHPTFAYEMLSPIRYLRQALDIPYCHHEKWDGTGYPNELKGDQIPLIARIFSVVDVWDALISDRPYRSAWTKEKAHDHIQTSSGSHFDPQVVEIFMHMPT